METVRYLVRCIARNMVEVQAQCTSDAVSAGAKRAGYCSSLVSSGKQSGNAMSPDDVVVHLRTMILDEEFVEEVAARTFGDLEDVDKTSAAHTAEQPIEEALADLPTMGDVLSMFEDAVADEKSKIKEKNLPIVGR